MSLRQGTLFAGEKVQGANRSLRCAFHRECHDAPIIKRRCAEDYIGRSRLWEQRVRPIGLAFKLAARIVVLMLHRSNRRLPGILRYGTLPTEQASNKNRLQGSGCTRFNGGTLLPHHAVYSTFQADTREIRVWSWIASLKKQVDVRTHQLRISRPVGNFGRGGQCRARRLLPSGDGVDGSERAMTTKLRQPNPG